MGMLLRYEAYPQWFTRTIPGYRGLISDTLLARESWSRILIGGIPAGYHHTSLGINDDTPMNLLEINSRVHLRVRLLGESRRVFSQTLVALDRDFELYSFDASVSAGDLSVRAEGTRGKDGRFEIAVTTGGTRTVRTVEIPPGTFLYSPVQELALRNLRTGSRLSLRTINPLTLQATTVMVESLGRERLPGSPDVAPVDAMRIRSSWQGLHFDSWVGEDGVVLRQETPMGWIIEACTAAEALDAVSSASELPDLFGTVTGGRYLLNLLMGQENTAP